MDRAHRDLVVIGASAGGLAPILTLLASLPADLPAAIVVVVHVAPHQASFLPQLLDRAGPFRARHPMDGDPLTHGTVFVAPPDHHVLVQGRVVRVTRGARENGARPAVDPLFRTAARSVGPRAVAIVLSGTLDDGTAGLVAVKAAGGVTIVQDPSEARYLGMPTSAIAHVAVDYVVTVAAMRDVLVRRVAEHVLPPAFDGGAQSDDEDDARAGAADEATRSGSRRSNEQALWTALRHLDESAALARRISDRAATAQRDGAVRFFSRRALQAERNAAEIRALLGQGTRGPTPRSSGRASGPRHR